MLSSGQLRSLGAATPRSPGGLRRLVRALGVVGALVGLAVVAGCGTEAGTRPGGARYAALGDSYGSGAGIAPVADAGCHRSTVDYGSLVAKEMGYTSFRDVSCGGAATVNLLRPQTAQGASNGAQLDAVGTRTRLVTVTLGLNDGGLSYNLLLACLAPTGEPSDYCKFLLRGKPSDGEKAFADAADQLEDALEQIHRAAPKARIILVGYPRIYPDSGSCPDRVPMVPQIVPVLRAALKTVNEEWNQAAKAGCSSSNCRNVSAGMRKLTTSVSAR